MCHLRLRLRNEEPILGGRPLIAGRADRTRESCGKQTMMMFDDDDDDDDETSILNNLMMFDDKHVYILY